MKLAMMLKFNRQKKIFRINYFLVVVDIAISSLKTRFEQLKAFENVFGFLFDSNRLKAMNDKELRDSCAKFHSTFSHDDSFDVDFNDFYSELKVLQVTLPNESMFAINILKFVKSAECYPNVLIGYRIFLTLPVTVASAERSFSKLNLIKTYLRSLMSQERLNGLAILSIETKLLVKIDADVIIDDCFSKCS